MGAARWARSGAHVAGALAAVVFAWCGGSTTKQAGTEGGPCYGNGTCDGALTCLSQTCVNATPPGDALSDEATDIPAVPEVDVAPADQAESIQGARIAVTDADFGFVPEGECRDAVLVVASAGLADLRVSSVRYSGAPGFTMTWPCQHAGKDATKPVALDDGSIDSATCDDLVVPANSQVEVKVTFCATCDHTPGTSAKCPPEARAHLTIVSNDFSYDASKGEGATAELRANVGGKCLTCEPQSLEFGSVVAPGEYARTMNLYGCGDATVNVVGFSVENDTPDVFKLVTPDASGTTPLAVDAGQKQPFTVKCAPQQADKGADGKFVQRTATVVVTSDAIPGQLKCPVTCTPVDAEGAVCEFKILDKGVDVTDRDDVQLQEKLTLKDASYALMANDAIVSWMWTLTNAPPTNKQAFVPGGSAQNPAFTVNDVGVIDTSVSPPADSRYEFTLTVTTKFGVQKSCHHHVGVPAPAGCHIELTWTTPADPNPFDECPATENCGSDMDLHVVDPLAVGCGSKPDLDGDGEPDGFFDLQYDCFWFHADPIWDAAHKTDPDYQPHLDRDCTSGWGPENFTYRIPEAGRCYKVGVHYYDDHGFGRSYPTVNIWKDGKPIYSKTVDTGIKNLDMWEVGSLCCSKGTFDEFTTPQGGPLIVSNYVCADFAGQ